MQAKFIRMKDLVKEAEIRKKYKIHRNLLSALIKESKLKYFNKYFQDNSNNNNNFKNLITLNSSLPLLSLLFENFFNFVSCIIGCNCSCRFFFVDSIIYDLSCIFIHCIRKNIFTYFSFI